MPLCMVGEQGWRSGESTRLPPMWPAFKSRRRHHMWVEFVFCCWFSPLLREVFLWVLRFSPLLKNQHSKFQFDQESGRRRTTMWMCYLQIVIYLFYLFIWSQFYLIRGFTYLLHVCAGFMSEALFIIILIIGFTQ